MALEPSKFLHGALSFLSLSMVKHQDPRASKTRLSPWPFNEMPFANTKFPGATAVNSFPGWSRSPEALSPSSVTTCLASLGCLLYPLCCLVKTQVSIWALHVIPDGALPNCYVLGSKIRTLWNLGPSCLRALNSGSRQQTWGYPHRMEKV